MRERKVEARFIESRQRWQCNVQTNGVRKTFTSSIPGRRGKIDAERKADIWLDTQIVGENAKASATIAQYLETIDATASSTYRAQQHYYMGMVRDCIGNKKMVNITPRDLQAIVDKYYRFGKDGEGLSAATLKGLRASMSAWLKYCRSMRCTTLTAESIKIPKAARQTEKTIATKEDIRVLFSVDATVWNGERVRDFFVHAYRFLAVVGLRPGELLAIERRDIADGKLTIRHSYNNLGELTDGKNKNARRTIALPQIALDILDQQQEMLRERGIVSKYVFPDEYGRIIQQYNLRRTWRRYCESNGINHAQTPYELRHTFVSIVDEMPRQLKKMIVGHSESMDTEGIYGHEKQGDMQRAATYMNDAFLSILK